MNISPQDIRQKQFKLKFRGFDMVEVDNFLEDITSEMEDLLKENEELNDKVASLEKQLAEFRESEKGLRGALSAAQKMSEDMKAASEKDAQLKLKEAEVEAERILQDARVELAKTRDEVLEIKRIKQRYMLKVRGVIEDHLKMLIYEEKRGEEKRGEEKKGEEKKGEQK